jgi:trehalose 6-phosphate synthase
MRQIILAILVVVAIVCLIGMSFTYNQIQEEGKRLENDIRARSTFIADNLKDSVEINFANKSQETIQSTVERYTDNNRIAGLAVTDNAGSIVAASSILPPELTEAQKIAVDVMDGDIPNGNFLNFNSQKMYVFASPLHDKKNVVGSLIIVQNAGYIDNRLSEIWKENLLRLFVQSLLITIAVFLILRWIIIAPIGSLVTSMQMTRRGSTDNKVNKVFNNPIFGPLLQEVGNMQQNLIEARIAASEEARLRLKKLDAAWTSERLSAFVQSILKDRTIFVVSNREPYIHVKTNGKIQYYVPASGMVTAIEPLMQACGGMWISQATGNADKQVVDKEDKIRVPPADPRYTLKRIWLTEEEEMGFYNGFSNEGFWPLCHIAHTRPIFRKSDWEQYYKVNKKFAQTVLKEIKDHKNPIIMIQDFHFALLPRMIKQERPDATIGLFWHIPWPNAESFSICPWKKEILDGMLGADVIGFHTQVHCNNFISTVGRELEALIDLDRFTITKNRHESAIKPFPISIAFTKSSPFPQNNKTGENQKLLEKLGIKTKYIALGVDRLDYTKGVLERLKAVELFLTNHPSYIEKFTFLQISAPSRDTIKHYIDFEKNVQKEIDRVNNQFKRNDWKPIHYIKKHHSHEEIYPLYKAANVCLVTSLHDGMNLVAKEFVSARDDEKGILILSQFTGASRELRDALIVNPYNGEQTAEAIHQALRMKKSEQIQRMRRMREIIKSYNIYRWSAELLKTMVDLG